LRIFIKRVHGRDMQQNTLAQRVRPDEAAS
jgi:hypothetical protein